MVVRNVKRQNKHICQQCKLKNDREDMLKKIDWETDNGRYKDGSNWTDDN